MTQQTTDEQKDDSAQKRGRGPTRPVPSTTLEETLLLPKSILEYGLEGKIQRLTLLDELSMPPSSSKTRDLITSSRRYGLTDGSHSAPWLSVTEKGRSISESDTSSPQFRIQAFELAIDQFEPFKQLYDKVKDKRLREDKVLQAELGLDEFSESTRSQAANVFTENLRFIGLVQDVSGSEYVRDIEQIGQAAYFDADTPETESTDDIAEVEIHEVQEEAVAVPVSNGNVGMSTNRPALHIDIQIHIDPTSSAEQIDQIFASMAKHLYGEGS